MLFFPPLFLTDITNQSGTLPSDLKFGYLGLNSGPPTATINDQMTCVLEDTCPLLRRGTRLSSLSNGVLSLSVNGCFACGWIENQIETKCTQSRTEPFCTMVSSMGHHWGDGLEANETNVSKSIAPQTWPLVSSLPQDDFVTGLHLMKS